MRATTFLAALIVCLTFTAATPSRADEAQDASAFADALGHKALAIITDASSGKDDKQKQLETLFEQNVDIDWIGRFVLGRYWRTASDDQKQNYQAAFRAFTIRHYTSNISDFTDVNFSVSRIRPDGNGGNIVSIRIKRPKGEDILAEYTIRTKEGEGLKIYDISVEGVSMITTQRSEFNSVVSQKGLDYLIGQLQKRSQTDAGIASK